MTGGPVQFDQVAGPSDIMLVRAARAHDPTAFETLVTRHRHVVWAVCLRITGNAYDAEDALQDTLLQAWRGLEQFRGDSSFGTWLYRIATHASIGIARRRGARTWELSEQHRDDRDFAEAVAASDFVQRTLRALPDNFRVALVLFELCDFTYEQIAEFQGVGIPTVKTRIHRARKALRVAVQEMRD